MTATDPIEVLQQLPQRLWPPLLHAVRQAAQARGRSQLPLPLRPYAGFSPARLAQGRAKEAVISALATDARLRESVGRVLGVDVWRQAESDPAHQLVQRLGAPVAAAALVVRERWSDVADLGERLRAAEEQRPQPATPAPAGGPDPASKAAHAALRRERDAALRRAEAAEQRAAALAQEVASLRARAEGAEAERAAAERRHDNERSRSRDRVARLQRRISDAESRSRVDAERLEAVAADLERLAGAVRGGGGAQPVVPTAPVPAHAEQAGAIPRSVRAATPGRPCVLPPGVTEAQPAAAAALLGVAGIQVVVDGYNVTKDLRGVPAAALPEQRAWLERLLAGTAAGRDLRMTVVFDGEGDRTSAAAASRIVRTVFTAQSETADQRIVAIVADLPPATPALVVTSDREVASACKDLRANVVASGVFLQAVA